MDNTSSITKIKRLVINRVNRIVYRKIEAILDTLIDDISGKKDKKKKSTSKSIKGGGHESSTKKDIS